MRPEVEASLDRRDRHRGPAREAGGGRLGLDEELVLGHDPMNQAEREGLGRRQRSAFENVLERARGAQHAQQPMRAAAAAARWR